MQVSICHVDMNDRKWKDSARLHMSYTKTLLQLKHITNITQDLPCSGCLYSTGWLVSNVFGHSFCPVWKGHGIKEFCLDVLTYLIS